MQGKKKQKQGKLDNPVIKKQKKIQKRKYDNSKRRINRLKKLKPQQRMKPEINDPNYKWNQDDDFVVQRIVSEQIVNGQKYYLIKWKGFDITLSTWEKAEKFKAMTDLIDNFKRKSQKQKRDNNIREEANILMNPYRATQIHGHFLYGDEPNQIVNTIVQFDSFGNKTIYLEVSWKNRIISQGEMILQNSILTSDVIFEHNPQFLLNYYKKSLQLKPLKKQ